jgi:hypothetical protein
MRGWKQGGSNGAIWLDVMERGEHLSLPRLTVFLDRANVRPLQRQLGAIAAELASMNDGLEAGVADITEVVIAR